MKKSAALLALMLSGCGTMKWERPPEANRPECVASCDAHFDQCPQIFAGFPELAAVECPAEHDNCLRICRSVHASARPAATLPAVAPASAVAASATAPAGSAHMVSKEVRLRELKHFFDEGLVTEDVYRDRQKAILAEP